MQHVFGDIQAIGSTGRHRSTCRPGDRYRRGPDRGNGPLLCLFAIIGILVAGAGECRVRHLPFLQQLRAIPSAIEERLLFSGDYERVHRAVFAAHAARMVEGMCKADAMQREQALREGRGDSRREQWRLCLDPVGMDLMVDGMTHRFWSDEIFFNRYRTAQLQLFKAVAFTGRGEFLPWEIFRPIQYDQMPRQFADFVIERQLERFRDYLKPESWPRMGIDDWRKIPDPIREIAAYRMVWRWAGEYAPEGIRRGEAARIVASIGRVESLFDIDKVVHLNPATGEKDLGFMQISAKLRKRLRRLPEFKEYDDDDFLKPWVSIKAGAYSLFRIFLPEARGDMLEAIGDYNAGMRGLEEQAQKYLSAVILQHGRAFVNKHYSPTLRLILKEADAGYLQDVWADRLTYANQKSACDLSSTRVSMRASNG
jgi:soluble lytic murein transglycosylase-like protein